MKNQLIQKILNIDPEHLHAFSVGLLQGKAYRILAMHLNRKLSSYDLTIPEWKLLGQLYEHSEMSLADLADRLSVEPPLVTSLIDRLEKKDLVTRTLHKTDKRVKVVRATEKGMKLIPDVEKAVKNAMKNLLNGVSKKDALAYIRVLETIVNNG